MEQTARALVKKLETGGWLDMEDLRTILHTLVDQFIEAAAEHDDGPLRACEAAHELVTCCERVGLIMNKPH